MLLYEPIDYYRCLRARYANSYLAEDNEQVILGIDCQYIDAQKHDYHGLQSFYRRQKSEDIAQVPFGGLFGVLAYESIHFFENIPPLRDEQYFFPSFVFAHARAYLHYSKSGKFYSFYGDKEKYYNFLQEFVPSADEKNLHTSKPYYRIITDVKHEAEHFYHNIEIAKDYIHKGDAFQIVLSEQLKITSNIDSLDFYAALKSANPSPYMFHFPTPYGDVVGSSPEILVELKQEQIFIAPVAGTRPRGKDAIQDQALAQDLLSDEKELAEHRMLIDLARNDIGRFAEKQSVHVKNPMHVKYYQHVMHIVSEVYGKKNSSRNLFEILSAVFPAGTLSGTPKIRAMEIISELETYKRNVYGGGIGFLHYNGDMQIAIVIRTAFFAMPDKDTKNNIEIDKPDVTSQKTRDVFVQAGAGIVFDSRKENEYKEISHKRASLMHVFENFCQKKE